jgi:hypothetical protein
MGRFLDEFEELIELTNQLILRLLIVEWRKYISIEINETGIKRYLWIRTILNS